MFESHWKSLVMPELCGYRLKLDLLVPDLAEEEVSASPDKENSKGVSNS